MKRSEGPPIRLSWEEFERPIFGDERPFSLLIAYVWLLTHAAPRKCSIWKSKQRVPLERAQLAVTYRELAETWGWSKSKVNRFLRGLVEHEKAQLSASAGKGVSLTIITMLEYRDGRFGRARRTSAGTVLSEGAVDAKVHHADMRRRQFVKDRSRLILALLDSGAPYQCAHPGCMQSSHLTVDHKIPLSRGGSDDLTNLQFMCQRHNSEKSDRS